MINGGPEGPARVGVSVCDIAAGMTAFQAILQALLARERTGRGQGLEVSLFHAMADWMNVPYLQHAYGGHEPARSGLHHPTIAPYGAYPCGDGRAVLISIQNEREWESLCRLVLARPELAAHPDFATNPLRVQHRAALDRILLDVFARHDRDALVAKLEAARIAYGRLSSLDDLRRHPQARWIEVDTPMGPVELLAPGARTTGQTAAFGPVPALDQHGAALRAEFAPISP
jgi:crotonobetainyl-CoA:carnitine CoA-transferase CaiB-like acyl-CoA transferase